MEYFFLEGRPNISNSLVSVRKSVLIYSTSSFKESVADGSGFLTSVRFCLYVSDPDHGCPNRRSVMVCSRNVQNKNAPVLDRF